MSDDWQVVEEALQGGTKEPYLEVRRAKAWDALRSLARLREREAQLEREVAEWKADGSGWTDRYVTERNRAEAAEERLRAYLADHDRDINHYVQLVEAAEARVAELERELRQAEDAAQVQDLNGNEGDADAIRRDAIRSALGKYPDYKDGAWLAHKEETP